MDPFTSRSYNQYIINRNMYNNLKIIMGQGYNKLKINFFQNNQSGSGNVECYTDNTDNKKNDDVIDMNNVVIIDKIGSGAIGNVYKSSYKNTLYALKIEYISDHSAKCDHENDLSSKIWRELYFVKHLSNKYPEYFVHLYANDIINNCTEEKTVEQIESNERSNRVNDKYCSRKLYSLVDTTYDKIETDVNKSVNEMYSMLIQLLNIINILQSNKYLHGDTHARNIGIVYTDRNKTINIFGLDIPTYGRIFKLIDFGSVLHEDFDMLDFEKTKYYSRIGKEADRIYFGPIVSKFNYDNRKIYKKKYNFETDYQVFKKSDKYQEISDITNDKILQIKLYDILYPVQHIKRYYGYKNITYPTYLVPKQVLIYYIKTNRDVEKNINYLFEKIVTPDNNSDEICE
jgi:hypothetical protein